MMFYPHGPRHRLLPTPLTPPLPRETSRGTARVHVRVCLCVQTCAIQQPCMAQGPCFDFPTSRFLFKQRPPWLSGLCGGAMCSNHFASCRSGSCIWKPYLLWQPTQPVRLMQVAVRRRRGDRTRIATQFRRKTFPETTRLHPERCRATNRRSPCGESSRYR